MSNMKKADVIKKETTVIDGARKLGTIEIRGASFIVVDSIPDGWETRVTVTGYTVAENMDPLRESYNDGYDVTVNPEYVEVIVADEHFENVYKLDPDAVVKFEGLPKENIDCNEFMFSALNIRKTANERIKKAKEEAPVKMGKYLIAVPKNHPDEIKVIWFKNAQDAICFADCNALSPLDIVGKVECVRKFGEVVQQEARKVGACLPLCPSIGMASAALKYYGGVENENN